MRGAIPEGPLDRRVRGLDRFGQLPHRLGETLPLGLGALELGTRTADRLAALGELGVEGLQGGGGLGRVDLGTIQRLALLG